MYATKLSWTRIDRPASEVADLVEGLLAAWYKNGQIVMPWMMVNRPRSLDCMVRMPERESLDAHHDNECVQGEKRKLNRQNLDYEQVILGEDATSPKACGCPEGEGFVLFTHVFSSVSPIRCVACFGPVPLYRFHPVEGGEHLRLLQWEEDYRACDTLQLHGTTGEAFGEDQLANPVASLSKDGRGIAESIEATSGKPVFYYLKGKNSEDPDHGKGFHCPECARPGQPRVWSNFQCWFCWKCRLMFNEPVFFS